MEKISEVFNIFEVEEYDANRLLNTNTCVLLGCRSEKDEYENTKFIYSIGQYEGYSVGAISDAIFFVEDGNLQYRYDNQGTLIDGDARKILD